jgi:hypothetical protein
VAFLTRFKKIYVVPLIRTQPRPSIRYCETNYGVQSVGGHWSQASRFAVFFLSHAIVSPPASSLRVF